MTKIGTVIKRKMAAVTPPVAAANYLTPARQRWSTPTTNGSQYVFGAGDDLRLHVFFQPYFGRPEQAFLLRTYLATVESRRGKVGWTVKRNGECGWVAIPTHPFEGVLVRVQLPHYLRLDRCCILPTSTDQFLVPTSWRRRQPTLKRCTKTSRILLFV